MSINANANTIRPSRQLPLDQLRAKQIKEAMRVLALIRRGFVRRFAGDHPALPAAFDLARAGYIKLAIASDGRGGFHWAVEGRRAA